MFHHLGTLKIQQTKDWTNHSKVVIRTGNLELLQSLLHKTAEVSRSGLGGAIFSYGYRDAELRIFSQLGSAMEVLSLLLEGEDCDRLSAEAMIRTVN